jgi:hypothetical protein
MSDQPLDEPTQSEEIDTRAKSVPLPSEEGDRVVAQQNLGAEEAGGSGEWPSPHAAPTGPAPGTTPEGAQAASRRDQAPGRRPGGPFKPTLESDPMASGAQSTPDEEEAEPPLSQ